MQHPPDPNLQLLCKPGGRPRGQWPGRSTFFNFPPGPAETLPPALMQVAWPILKAPWPAWAVAAARYWRARGPGEAGGDSGSWNTGRSWAGRLFPPGPPRSPTLVCLGYCFLTWCPFPSRLDVSASDSCLLLVSAPGPPRAPLEPPLPHRWGCHTLSTVVGQGPVLQVPGLTLSPWGPPMLPGP